MRAGPVTTAPRGVAAPTRQLNAPTEQVYRVETPAAAPRYDLSSFPPSRSACGLAVNWMAVP